MVINKSASKRTVNPGGVLGYKLTVRNKGNATANHVVVCDTLPKHQHLLRTDPQADRSSDRSACWRVRRLPPGEKRTFRIVAQVDESSPPGKQRNVAVVDSKGGKRKRDDAGVTVGGQNAPCRSRGTFVPDGISGRTGLASALPTRRC